ncbi:Amidase [Purpureocillium takamizusanense]|uniref:amidase n=1 Tax=Purpureocillium takamizusanense TaxID=2060973 RepID=A0A9Q8V9A5_9HYPO|nr:Amidase [Purpureocillium takamizusanense]UNI16476.1 Amidase [Purpureocillium takamizusanense]
MTVTAATTTPTPTPAPAPTDWQTRAAAKRKQRDEAIPVAWRLGDEVLASLQTPLESNRNNVLDVPRRSGILSERELHITEGYDVKSLLAALAGGDMTAVEVTAAFSKRAAIAQQVTNCLTETYFAGAEKRARELDALREGGQLAGPLHGLPVSIKDSFQVTGSQATIGLVGFLDRTSEANSALVDMLLGLGAVLYCKTNVPQTLMTCDSQNNVFGRTLNPWNTSLGAGGSSGGEGALVAMRGSPLGVGTDLGGSVRIPALCCGTYGFRPTTGRIPYGRQARCATPGHKTIVSCAGPLANDMDSMGVFLKSVIDARPWLHDATAVDVPWRDVSRDFVGRKLRLGLLAEDPVFPLHPPVRKAVAEAVRLLEAAGHEVVRLTVEEGQMATAAQVAWHLFALDDGPARTVAAAGEPPIPSLLCMAERVSGLDMSFVADVPAAAVDGGLKRLAALNVKRHEIEDRWRRVWVERGPLDGVVAPSAQNTAVEHDEYGAPPYTLLLNVLDYPACVIPFGRADESTSAEPFELAEGQTAPPYHPERIRGAPCSIQVFASTMRDEECFEVARVVDVCVNASRAKS